MPGRKPATKSPNPPAINPRTMTLKKYEITPNVLERLNKTYIYHSPKEDQPERYTAIREKSQELAELICESCPPSRELSLALTSLEQVSMQANAAIARNE